MMINKNGLALISLLLSTARRSCKGFTLIELLVVIAISVGLGGIFLPRLTNFRESQTLKNNLNDLSSALNLAKSNSQNGLKCGANINSTDKATAWNLKVSGASNYSIEPTCISSSGSKLPALPQINYQLQSNQVIDKIYVDGTLCADVGQPMISFENLSGKISFDDFGSSCNSYKRGFAKVTLVIKGSSSSGAVAVERGGNIYVTTPP